MFEDSQGLPDHNGLKLNPRKQRSCLFKKVDSSVISWWASITPKGARLSLEGQSELTAPAKTASKVVAGEVITQLQADASVTVLPGAREPGNN